MKASGKKKKKTKPKQMEKMNRVYVQSLWSTKV